MPRFDTHLHTYRSPCGHPEMTPANIFRQARRLSLSGLCLTDHLHYDTPFQQFYDLRKEIQQTDPADLDVRLGCEVDVLGQSKFTIAPHQMSEFDVILAAPMHWLSEAEMPENLDPKELARFLLSKLSAATDCPGVDIIVHPIALPSERDIKCFPEVVIPYVLANKELTSFLRSAARKSIALEVSVKYILSPYHDLVKRFYWACLEEGVRLSLSSDGHSLAAMDIWRVQEEFVNRLGVTDASQLWRPEAERARHKKAI